MFDIYRCTQAANIFGDIIAEDDAAHRRFARTRLAHQEDLLLLGFLEAVHPGSFSRLSIKCSVASIVGVRRGRDLWGGNADEFFEGMEYDE